VNAGAPAPYRTQWRVVAALYTAVLLVGSHLPGEALPLEALAEFSGIQVIDKPLHVGGYLVLGLLVFGPCGFGRGWPAAAWWLAGLAVFAALDELTQPWFGRYLDVNDWLADVAGFVAAWLLVRLWLVMRPPSNRVGSSPAVPSPAPRSDTRAHRSPEGEAGRGSG
jgi:VanZ family protein